MNREQKKAIDRRLNDISISRRSVGASGNAVLFSPVSANAAHIPMPTSERTDYEQTWREYQEQEMTR